MKVRLSVPEFPSLMLALLIRCSARVVVGDRPDPRESVIVALDGVAQIDVERLVRLLEVSPLTVTLMSWVASPGPKVKVPAAEV